MSHDGALPQLTVRAVLLGMVLSMVLAGANAYLGLFAGLTVSASIPAAVISMGILRLLRNANILENNIVQTAASAGEALAAGIIFTLPALIILGYWEVFDSVWVSVIAGLGGLLGVLFTVPLRRALIVEQPLAYPEGAATAEVLRVGDEGGAGVKYLGWAALAGAGVKLCEVGLRLWPGSIGAGIWAGPGIAYLGTALSPALLAVGYIVSINIAALVFVGGAIAWFVAIPVYAAGWGASDPVITPLLASGASATDVAWQIWNTKIRYLGVGAMLVGGVWALISMRSSLWSGIASGLDNLSSSDGVVGDHTEKDLPMRWVLIGIALLTAPIFVLYHSIVGTLTLSITMTAIMVVSGFLFASVAAYMAGLVGSSNNPVSGITIATILFAAMTLSWLAGPDTGFGAPAAILIGAVVCCAAAIGGDNMQDLKAGYLLGATPWRQQLMQCVGVVSAVLVMAPILNLLLKAYGMGAPTPEQPDALLAPQATLMASVAQGVFGGGLPWEMVWIGVGIGCAVIVCDEILRLRRSNFRAPVLAVAVGIYLPLELAVPIFAGGLIAHGAARVTADRADRGEPSRRNGMLLAAGLITGEALIGILIAIPIVASGDRQVLALGWSLPLAGLFGLLVVGAIAVKLYRVAIANPDQPA